MPTDLPYMTSVGNVPAMLDKIRGAGTPPKFTIEFLKSTLGFTASQDRSFPRILRQLGFLNSDGTPLPRYNEFKSATTGNRVLAQGLREGWAPVFLADQEAHKRSAAELTETFKTVTGTGEAVARKLASTFKALATRADWTGSSPTQADGEEPLPGNDVETSESTASLSNGVTLHQDVHVHLPPTSDVAVYRAIFRALREELL